MKKTFNVQFAVFGPAAEGQSAQHRPQTLSGQKSVMAADGEEPAIITAVRTVLAAHPNAEVTAVHQTGVIDLEG